MKGIVDLLRDLGGARRNVARASCMYCDETLKFTDGRGWTHLDGEFIRVQLARCRFCQGDGCRSCTNGLIERDHHVATPRRSR